MPLSKSLPALPLHRHTSSPSAEDDLMREVAAAVEMRLKERRRLRGGEGVGDGQARPHLSRQEQRPSDSGAC